MAKATLQLLIHTDRRISNASDELARASKTPNPKPRLSPEPARELLQLTVVMHALSDPMRVQIVRAIAQVEAGASCRDCTCPSVPKSTLAHHFKVLRSAGLIHSSTQGSSIHNTLRRNDLDARFPGLLTLVLRID
jgi:DNA-binding transcriptional ArsR family regulator